MTSYSWITFNDKGVQTVFLLVVTMMKPWMPFFTAMGYIIGVWIGVRGELIQEAIVFILRYKFYKREADPPWNPDIL